MSKHKDSSSDEFPQLDAEQVKDRRRFMQRTLSLTATLAAAGITESVLEAALMNDAEAADMRSTKMVPTKGAKADFANALSMSARDGDTRKALDRFGGKLSSQERQIMEKLSPGDLRTLMNLKRKLGGGKAACCDAGTGIF